VEQLAEAVRLSPHQFTWVFGQKPISRLPAPLRILGLRPPEAARYLLEQGRLPVERIAQETVFGDRERMSRSVVRSFGLWTNVSGRAQRLPSTCHDLGPRWALAFSLCPFAGYGGKLPTAVIAITPANDRSGESVPLV
jgi:hypothetical protein